MNPFFKRILYMGVRLDPKSIQELPAYLNGFSEFPVNISTTLSNHVTEVSSHVERVEVSHAVEVEVVRPHLLPQVATLRTPVLLNPLQVKLQTNKQKSEYLSWDCLIS